VPLITECVTIASVAIKTFSCADTEALFKLRRVARFANIERPALRKLKQLDLARRIEDLRAPPANRLGWSLRLQADYDTELTKSALARTLAKIKPWSASAEHKAPAH